MCKILHLNHSSQSAIIGIRQQRLATSVNSLSLSTFASSAEAPTVEANRDH